jgi:hypothetical protein
MRRTFEARWLFGLLLLACLAGCGQEWVTDDDWAFVQRHFRMRAEGHVDSVLAEFVPEFRSMQDDCEKIRNYIADTDSAFGGVRSYTLNNWSRTAGVAIGKAAARERPRVELVFLVKTKGGYRYGEKLVLKPGSGRQRILRYELTAVYRDETDSTD